jgi:hypothetical protein
MNRRPVVSRSWLFGQFSTTQLTPFDGFHTLDHVAGALSDQRMADSDLYATLDS